MCEHTAGPQPHGRGQRGTGDAAPPGHGRTVHSAAAEPAWLQKRDPARGVSAVPFVSCSQARTHSQVVGGLLIGAAFNPFLFAEVIPSVAATERWPKNKPPPLPPFRGQGSQRFAYN